MYTRTLILSLCLLLLGLNACQTTNQSEETGENPAVVTKPETEDESPAQPTVQIDREATDRARIMGAVDVGADSPYDSTVKAPTTQAHYQQFNAQWQKLEDSRLSKIRVWQEQELSSFNEKENRNLFYPFSGPDFLNAYMFFPNCDNYIMFGLEPNGKLINMKDIGPDYLAGLRNSLAEIFERNYFITSYMSSDLWGKGVLPIINIFLARTDNQIVEMQRFYLDAEGKPQFYSLEGESPQPGQVNGLEIKFLNTKKTKAQTIYYFGTDVEDSKMQQKMELVSFIKSFPNKYTFIKSASYILHNTNFKVMRDLVMNESEMVLQDDTGVRYQLFADSGWDIQLYGKYARPVRDFGSYTFQPALQQAFNTAENVKPLDFTFGYHWKTDNSSVLLCVPPQAQPGNAN